MTRRNNHNRRLVLESLERRELFNVDVQSPVTLSPADQFLLEQINESRANPTQAAQQMGFQLGWQERAGRYITSHGKQPLSPHVQLEAAIRSHIGYLDGFGYDTPAAPHLGPDGANPESRARDRGYDVGSVRESLVETFDVLHTSSVRTSRELLESSLAGVHSELLRNPEDRWNTLYPASTEVGLAVGEFHTGVSYGRSASAGSSHFITGVVYSDVVAAGGKYNIGEGLRMLKVTARPANSSDAFVTYTGVSGGYAVKVPHDGAYEVEFEIDYDKFSPRNNRRIPGQVHRIVYNVLVSGRNYKQDMVLSEKLKRAYNSPRDYLTGGGRTTNSLSENQSSSTELQPLPVGPSTSSFVLPAGPSTSFYLPDEIVAPFFFPEWEVVIDADPFYTADPFFFPEWEVAIDADPFYAADPFFFPDWEVAIDAAPFYAADPFFFPDWEVAIDAAPFYAADPFFFPDREVAIDTDPFYAPDAFCPSVWGNVIEVDSFYAPDPFFTEPFNPYWQLGMPAEPDYFAVNDPAFADPYVDWIHEEPVAWW